MHHGHSCAHNSLDALMCVLTAWLFSILYFLTDGSSYSEMCYTNRLQMEGLGGYGATIPQISDFQTFAPVQFLKAALFIIHAATIWQRGCSKEWDCSWFELFPCVCFSPLFQYMTLQGNGTLHPTKGHFIDSSLDVFMWSEAGAVNWWWGWTVCYDEVSYSDMFTESKQVR